ncbi:extracellular solute-binding protein [Herbiconiux sp. CPCC 203407]|uniref:Extracellular solute-binding protein n=1 Tax=Herbiconiux oxytropis TaxID=2970915 RepID=A0AA41XH87_9MICO|nr:extracellular solute-binding protein [Herbiconiux oxytropis]MCS5723692.1 extracellular solute-binding protein [Herbiconiux oxytropis]MCS5728101.1 extracellular solute-binding protein [Herbiconiux oxytropis]
MVSRSRTISTALSLVAVAGLLAACSSTPTAGGGSSSEPAADAATTITFVGYGGGGQDAQIEAWQTPYTEAHPNVTFVNTSPPDVAQVKAQVDSGSVQWDVVATAPYAAQQNCDTLFEPLDLSAIDQTDLVEGTVGECYLGNWINATPIAYRTDAFPEGEGPKTVEDFFDTEKFPGQRGIVNNLQNGILEYPLLADGVAPDDLYPLDVDRALEKLGEIRDDTTFAPNVGALQQAVEAGQVDMFLLPDSRLVPLMQSGLDITVVWDETVASLNAFAIPKGAPNKDAAVEFISSVVEPEQVAKISELLGVAPVNTAAKPELDEFTEKVEVYGPANTGGTVLQDIDWYAENFNDVSNKLTTWLAG